MGNENGDGELKKWPRLVENPSGRGQEPEKSTFRAFGSAIQAGDIRTAGGHLSALMDLSEEEGLTAAKFFEERMKVDPATIARAMQMRGAIAEGRTNDAMEALIECFGLDGLRSIVAMQALGRPL